MSANTTALLSTATRHTAGIILLTIVAIEFGGWHMLRIVRGQEPLTDFQKAFARAGHAHAGVLVTLGLVGLVFADAADLSGPLGVCARNGIWLAAILMPTGFFASSAGKGLTQPNRAIALLYAGAASLGVGAVTLGIALLRT